MGLPARWYGDSFYGVWLHVHEGVCGVHTCKTRASTPLHQGQRQVDI